MKVKCWKCGGKGWLFDHLEGIFTFGVGYLIQALAGKNSYNIDGEPINKRCPVCNGNGYQETKELAQKAMRDEFNATVNDGTFELKEFSTFATVCDKCNCWVIEEREVKGAPDNGNNGMD